MRGRATGVGARDRGCPRPGLPRRRVAPGRPRASREGSCAADLGRCGRRDCVLRDGTVRVGASALRGLCGGRSGRLRVSMWSLVSGDREQRGRPDVHGSCACIPVPEGRQTRSRGRGLGIGFARSRRRVRSCHVDRRASATINRAGSSRFDGTAPDMSSPSVYGLAIWCVCCDRTVLASVARIHPRLS